MRPGILGKGVQLRILHGNESQLAVLINVHTHLLDVRSGSDESVTQQFNLLNFKAFSSLRCVVTKMDILMLKFAVNSLHLAHCRGKYHRNGSFF